MRVLPANGTGPIAEASDAGTLQHDGIAGAAGLPLTAVFMNPNGADGYLAESGSVGNQQMNTQLALLEPLDLQSGSLTAQPFALTSNFGDIGVYPFVQEDAVVAESSIDGTSTDYARASPLSAGFTRFSFPPVSLPSTAVVYAAAGSSSPAKSAYIAQDLATGDYLVTRGDVTTGTQFSPAIDLTTAFGPAFDPYAPFTLAYDPGTDRAYLLMEDQTLPCEQQSPQLATIDFTTGAATARTLNINAGDTHGMYQLAIDPGTHIAAISTACAVTSTLKYRTELTLLDLSSGTATQVYQHQLHDELIFHGGFMLGGDSPGGRGERDHARGSRARRPPDDTPRPGRGGARRATSQQAFPAQAWPGCLLGSFSFSGVNGATRIGAAQGQLEADGFFAAYRSVQPYAY